MCADSSNGSSAFKYGLIGFVIGAAVGALSVDGLAEGVKVVSLNDAVEDVDEKGASISVLFVSRSGNDPVDER